MKQSKPLLFILVLIGLLLCCAYYCISLNLRVFADDVTSVNEEVTTKAFEDVVEERNSIGYVAIINLNNYSIEEKETIMQLQYIGRERL